MRTILLVLLLVATPVPAQETNPLKWSEANQKKADAMSNVFVGSNIAAETIHSWRAPNRRHAFFEQACQTAFAVGVSQTIKMLVHRTRPDGSTRDSVPSMHTAVATANSGWNRGIGISFTIGTAYGRMAANRHFFTDTAAGFGIGFVGDKVCH